jgi:hypothetical protein
MNEKLKNYRRQVIFALLVYVVPYLIVSIYAFREVGAFGWEFISFANKLAAAVTAMIVVISLVVEKRYDVLRFGLRVGTMHILAHVTAHFVPIILTAGGIEPWLKLLILWVCLPVIAWVLSEIAGTGRLGASSST